MKHVPAWLKSLFCVTLAVVLVSLAATPALAVVPYSSTLAPYASQTYIVNCSALNMRQSPQMGSYVLKVLPRGTVVTYLDDKSGWWYVSAGKYGYGWVDKKYLAPSATGAATGNYVVTASQLNVRNYPKVDAKRVGYLNKGTVINISELNGDWGYSSTAGGWVALKYLSPTSASPSSVVDFKSGGTYRVTASKLNVRESASTSGKVTDLISKGTSVTITYTTGNWAWVTYGSGRSGFVSLSYLG